MIGNNSFRGEVPATTPRLLPENAAQIAMNARLKDGDLTAWRQFLEETVLSVPSEGGQGPALTIFKLNDIWLSWTDDVDVARGLVPGDETFRTYLTSPTRYERPQFTTYDMATAGSEPFPVETRPLGVPNPQEVATLTVGADPTPSSFSIDVEDAGGELATGWSVSPVVSGATFNSSVSQQATGGNPDSYYELRWRDYGDSGGVGTWLKRDFGVSAATVVSMAFDFSLNDAGGISRLFAGVQRNEIGSGVAIGIQHNPDLGGSGWVIQVGSYTTWAQGQYMNVVSQSATFAGMSVDTFFRGVVTVTTNALDGTKSVTFTVSDGGDELATLTATLSLDSDAAGGWCGFTSGDDQRGSDGIARIDNIHVQGTGATGYTPANLSTAYVWTYVNDLGQESGPSIPTAAVLRPDGISVTVTMPALLPSGYGDYTITHKRVYRLVTGLSGTVYKRVGEVEVLEPDFLDDRSDEQLAQVPLLISDIWALPPDALQGIITLPNGALCGFFLNQLCYSEPGYPHAWPVEYRKTAASNIVGIANIDTTVVVGTESHVQTCTGNDPASATMSQPGEAQACVSKRGMKFLDGHGVVFPSPDGYQLCRGSAGSVVNMTEKVFTREQWQAQRPESILAAVHDGVLHWFYDTDEAVTGSPWLIFLLDGEGASASPINIGTGGAYFTLNDPLPFEGAVVVASSDGGGNNTNSVPGGGLAIPLYSTNDTPTVAGGTMVWTPLGASEIEPRIVAGVPGSSGSEWVNSTHHLRFDYSTGLFPGWEGGILELFENNDVATGERITAITFLPCSSFYPPVSIEYVDAS